MCGTIYSWGEYITIAVEMAGFIFLRDCVKKWVSENDKTTLSTIAIIVCYLGILGNIACLVYDLFLILTN